MYSIFSHKIFSSYKPGFSNCNGKIKFLPARTIRPTIGKHCFINPLSNYHWRLTVSSVGSLALWLVVRCGVVVLELHCRNYGGFNISSVCHHCLRLFTNCLGVSIYYWCISNKNVLNVRFKTNFAVLVDDSYCLVGLPIRLHGVVSAGAPMHPQLSRTSFAL